MDKTENKIGNTASSRLAKGTIVYMAGNMTSRVLQMLILPIITDALETKQYGYYDLIVSTINLVIPIVTLQILDGMFRYMIKADEDKKKKTISSVTGFIILGSLVLALTILVIRLITVRLQYPCLIYLNYISAILYSFMQKTARCEQKNKLFAVSGVVNTLVMLAFQALTLVIFKMGVDGMLISNCASYFIASLFLIIGLRISKYLSIKDISIPTIKNLLHFSIPLVPNSVCWWLVDSSDRYIISFFLDSSATGVYAIAGKFSQLLVVLTSVFQLSWQENAILELDSKERDAFYTNTFNRYMRLLLCGYLVILPFIRIITPVLLAADYQVGIVYNPVLLIGAIFSAFSQFYGSAYLVFEKTKGALLTTVVAAIINISTGCLLIGKIGLFAPALGTVLSFLVQWIMRAFQMRSYFKVKIDIPALVILLIFASLITYLYYLNYIWVQYIAFVIGFIVFIIMNASLIKSIVAKFLHR